MEDTGKSLADPERREPGVHFDARLPRYSQWRRMQIWLIGAAVVCVARMLGPTLRYEILGWPRVEGVYAQGKRGIGAFWHRALLGMMWWGRNRKIVIMHSTNFDGQWAGKAGEWLGYGTAHGSSTRGGLRGLAELARRLEQGRDVLFTVDGPRGPRFVAKPGPVMLARTSGCPVMVFGAGFQRAHTIEKSWDHFQIPKPFSRVVMLFAQPIYVPAGADRETMEQKQAEMQRELDRLHDIGDSWFTMTEEDRNRHRAEFRT